MLVDSAAAASVAQFTATNLTVRRREDDRIERRIARQINVRREDRDHSRLRCHRQLDRAAERHARHMAAVGKIGHEGIGDGTPGQRIRAAGYDGSWGEVLAAGYTSANGVVEGWMHSRPHRKVIMNGRYTHVGVGHAVGADGRMYFAAVTGYT